MKKYGDIIARHLEAGRLLQSDRFGLMWSPFQHRSETKEFAVTGLIHNHFLVILVHSAYAHPARNHNVGLSGGVADFVDALSRRKALHLDLAGQNGSLFVVEQREERYVFQFVDVTSHGSPQSCIGESRNSQQSIPQKRGTVQPSRAFLKIE